MLYIMRHGAMNAAIISQIKNLPIDKFWSAGTEQCKLLKLM